MVHTAVTTLTSLDGDDLSVDLLVNHSPYPSHTSLTWAFWRMGIALREQN